MLPTLTVHARRSVAELTGASLGKGTSVHGHDRLLLMEIHVFAAITLSVSILPDDGADCQQQFGFWHSAVENTTWFAMI